MSETTLYDSEISFMKRINLVVDGAHCVFDDFAFINARIVLGKLLNDKHKQLLILHPTRELLTSLVNAVVPCALASCDIDHASRNITDHFHVGDKVKIGNCLGEIEKFTEEYGRSCIVIKFNNMKYYVPFEKTYILQKYEGSAENLNNYNPKPNKKINKQKAVLCDVLDLEETDLPPGLFSKTLIVSEKQKFINNIEKVQINGSSFTSVFPTGYIKEQGEFERIGSDPLQRHPIICVCSSLHNACEMVEKDSSIKSVIILDLKKLKGNYVYLERIKEKLINLILMQEIHNFEEDDVDKLAHIGFEIIQWSYETVKNLNLSVNPSISSRNQVGRSQRILFSIAHPSIDKKVIEGDGAILMYQADAELKKIKNADFESDYKIPFIARSYDALLSLRSIPIALDDASVKAGIQEQFDKLIKDLNEYYFQLSFSTHSDTLQSMKDIINIIEKLIVIHSKEHPKHAAFTITNQLGANDSIVVPKNKHKAIIEKWLNNKKGNNHGITVLTLSELGSVTRFFNTLLFTGWFGRKHAKLLLTPMAQKQCFLLYPFEYEWMEKNLTWLTNYLRTVSALKLLNNEAVINKYPIPAKQIEFDEYLRKMVESNQGFYQKLHSKYSEDNVTMSDCYYVEFEDDYYAFLTEGYNCRCLDKDNEIIVKKKVNELQPGDTLIFIKNSSEDIFARLVLSVETSSSAIREQLEISQLWRSALLKYKEKNNYEYEAMRKQLEIAGLKRVVTTIKLWLFDENLIGPDDDGIRAIAKMTGDYDLNSKLEQVIRACGQIRALHIKLGRYLAQSISSAVTSSNHTTKEDRLIRKLTDDLSQYALAVNVSAIATEKILLPSSKINLLIDK